MAPSPLGSPRRPRWKIVTGIAFVLSVAAYALQIEVAREFPLWLHIGMTAVGACAAGLAVALPYREEKRQEQLVEVAKSLAEQESTRVRTGLQDSLLLIANLLIEISQNGHATPGLEEQRLKQLVVSLLADRGGVDRARSAFFTYHPGTPGDPNDLRRLECDGGMSHGRSQGPRTVFPENTARGAVMLQMVDSRGSMIEKDVTRTEPAGWDDKGWTGERDYQTFIAVAVSAGTQTFGMLTLDAPDANSLGDVDHNAVRLFAQLLATGLAIP